MFGDRQRKEGLRPMPLSFVDWSGGKGIPEESSFDWAGAYSRYIEAYVGGRFANGLPMSDGLYIDCGFGLDGDNSRESGRGGGFVVGASGVGPNGDLRFGAFPSSHSIFDRFNRRPRDGNAIGLVNEGLSLGGVHSGCVAAGTEGGSAEGDAVLRGEMEREDSRVSVVSGAAGDAAGDAGDSRGNHVLRGKNYYSNKRKRELKKQRVKAERMLGSWRADDSDGRHKFESDSEVGVDQNVPTLAEFVSAKIDEEFVERRALDVEMKVAQRVAMQKAKKTLADKWAVENELAAAKAKRSLEVLMAQDVQAEIKRQSTYLKLQTEKNMVGMEKAHQFLKRTGNVPGFAQTVLSDEGLTDGSSASPASPGDCTISPDSSASMKEFREIVKQKADLEAKLEKVCKMTKVSLEDLDDYDKNTWSLKSENYEKLDRMYPGGYILDPVPDYVDYDPPTHGYLKF